MHRPLDQFFFDPGDSEDAVAPHHVDPVAPLLVFGVTPGKSCSTRPTTSSPGESGSSVLTVLGKN